LFVHNLHLNNIIITVLEIGIFHILVAHFKVIEVLMTPLAQNSCEETQDPGTLYIGDSISANIDIEVLQQGTGTQISAYKAYSSVYDSVSNNVKRAARLPNKNFTDVISAKQKRGNFSNMVVQSESVDITNLVTKTNPEKHFDYFRNQVEESAKNLFAACEKAVKINPKLKKVVIMKQIPRYDRVDLDPLSVKQALSQIFNNTLTDLWIKSPVKDKIFVGNHNIECSAGIRESRYRNIQTGAFDGVHLYGSSGRKAYTRSVLNILKQAGLVSSDFDHLSCAQTQYQSRQRGFNKPGLGIEMSGM
jgi:hypothetical protein